MAVEEFTVGTTGTMKKNRKCFATPIIISKRWSPLRKRGNLHPRTLNVSHQKRQNLAENFTPLMGVTKAMIVSVNTFKTLNYKIKKNKSHKMSGSSNLRNISNKINEFRYS